MQMQLSQSSSTILRGLDDGRENVTRQNQGNVVLLLTDAAGIQDHRSAGIGNEKPTSSPSGLKE
jgi:hypothetical protein